MSYKFTKQQGLIQRLVDGAFIPTEDDRNIDCKRYKEWLAAGNTPLPVDPPTPEELAEQAELAAQAQLRLETKATAMFNTLKNASLAQINNWVDTNFATLTATQRNGLKILFAVAGMYLRKK